MFSISEFCRHHPDVTVIEWATLGFRSYTVDELLVGERTNLCLHFIEGRSFVGLSGAAEDKNNASKTQTDEPLHFNTACELRELPARLVVLHTNAGSFDCGCAPASRSTILAQDDKG